MSTVQEFVRARYWYVSGNLGSVNRGSMFDKPWVHKTLGTLCLDCAKVKDSVWTRREAVTVNLDINGGIDGGATSRSKGGDISTMTESRWWRMPRETRIGGHRPGVFRWSQWWRQ
ncbi:hypothetical protein L6452_36990 [Arctium lappa]|uniref:Uncharacterized protein n=1 Tax=Arctium lappa TaxID=4217 RepID=A0ACB8Y1N1_ARCLA|nr:hypothetical protein L6452_36990 [Arctium lappa]